jgi:hypothetical protein
MASGFINLPVEGGGGGSGTVTSVGLSMPAIFSVAGSPITTAGTFTVSLVTETANRVWAGPSTGSPATPAFRALVAADLPAGTGTVTSVACTVPSFLSVAGSPVTSSGTLAITLATETANTIFAGPTSGGVATPTFRALVAADLPAGTGTVTSVACTVPSFLSVSGSPVTSSGTLAITLATETANTLFAGPTSGGVATPTFRAMVGADLCSFTGDVTNSAAAMTVAKIQGTTVSGTTGSTNVVFSASPTFTGTAALASATISTSLKNGNYNMQAGETNIGNSSTSFTADWSSNSAQLVTMTGNVTSVTFSNPQTGGSYLLRIATGAGSFSITGWPVTVKWTGGTAPTITATASKVDLINFYYDGTSYYGSYSQNY